MKGISGIAGAVLGAAMGIAGAASFGSGERLIQQPRERQTTDREALAQAKRDRKNAKRLRDAKAMAGTL